MLTRVEARRLSLPLTTPYHLSFGDVTAYDTVLVRLVDHTGAEGIGQATVLTGYTDERIDLLYNSLFREFLTYMLEDPCNIGMCTHLLFAAKNIERIGDHATNIAEMVFFAATGQYCSERDSGGSASEASS